MIKIKMAPLIMEKPNCFSRTSAKPSTQNMTNITWPGSSIAATKVSSCFNSQGKYLTLEYLDGSGKLEIGEFIALFTDAVKEAETLGSEKARKVVRTIF
jgi:hypothetical protein